MAEEASSSTIHLFRRGAERFGAHVQAVRDDQWHLPTPDSEWDVRALSRHLVHELLWVPELFAGKTVAEVGDRFEGDVLGRDPRAAYTEAAAEAMDAVEEPGALDRIVHL